MWYDLLLHEHSCRTGIRVNDHGLVALWQHCPDLIKGSNSIFGDIELDTPLESEFCALLDGTNRFNHRPTENFYFGKYLGFLPGNGLI